MSDSNQPLGLSLSEGLGPLPEAAQIAYVTDSVMRSHEVRSYTASQMRAYAAQAVAAERDCRTCNHWRTPHHRNDVMHCSAPLRCVAGSSYKRQGVVQLWESAPADAGF